ncbi:MAG TPA: PQQ-binding-like beta-propeller repeat protein [Gemmatimonadales bacterium]|nr:PQQ-binding-like beta-propeller repeat protein [Gemmatimonadales bacterium]
MAASFGCAPAMKPGPERQESGWPAYLGNPRHDAAAHETLNPDPRPLWHIELGRGARGSPALGETVMAVGTAERNLVLIDRTSGEILWRSHLDGTVRGGPLLDEDRLYVATESQPHGQVYAVRLRDGRQLWHARAGSVVAPLVLDSEAVYSGSEEGLVFRFESEHGTMQWRTALSGAVRAGPIITANGLLVATTTDTLYLLDRRTGVVQSRLKLPGTVLATPAIDSAGRRAYLTTTNGHVVAVDVAAWSVRWDRPAGDAIYGAPALVGDTLFVLSRDGRLWLIPIEAPETATSHALDIVASAGPTPVASGVLAASVSGEILLVDPATGAIRWRAQVAGPIEEPPLVRDRQVVVVAGRGNIHTYR